MVRGESADANCGVSERAGLSRLSGSGLCRCLEGWPSNRDAFASGLRCYPRRGMAGSAERSRIPCLHMAGRQNLRAAGGLTVECPACGRRLPAGMTTFGPRPSPLGVRSQGWRLRRNRCTSPAVCSSSVSDSRRRPISPCEPPSFKALDVQFLHASRKLNPGFRYVKPHATACSASPESRP